MDSVTMRTMSLRHMKRFIIIDGNALVHRAFHAIPPLTAPDGRVINAVYGFSSILLKVLSTLQPDYMAITFDVKEKTFRDDLYPAYKAKRVKQPQELYDQIPLVKEVVRVFGIPSFEKAGFEADDVIGTICTHPQVNTKDIEPIVLTGDLDTLQLIDKNTKVLTLKKGVSETFLYDMNAVVERFGITPEQIIDFKALRGDLSDNIPGVRGIGEKTAAELLQHFGALENIYSALENDNPTEQHISPRVARLLLKHRKEAFLSKKLATIVTTVPLDFQLEECRIEPLDREAVITLFSQYGFHSLLNRLSTIDVSHPGQGTLFKLDMLKKKFQYHLVQTREDFQRFFRVLKQKKQWTFDTETTSLDTLTAELVGISFSWKKGEAFFVSLRGKDGKYFLVELKKYLEHPRYKKSGHNMKYDYEVLLHHDITLQGMFFDSMIASYLLAKTPRSHSLDNLAFTEFGHEMVTFEELVGKKANQSGSRGKKQRAQKEGFLSVTGKQVDIRSVPLEHLALYSNEDADFTQRLVEQFQPKIKEEGFLYAFEQIEMPLIPVLAAMEMTGVKVDIQFLKHFGRTLERRLQSIDKRIYHFSGKHFNIDSPMQLKEILFQALKLSPLGLKKGKTGLSISASELEKIRDQHPIIPLLMEHRELMKLKTTYTDALPQLVHPKTGRIHTTFRQTVTATGRLSSSNPNLQNIPIRTELGSKIRKAFIAPEGYKIISCDYSQIELRIAAHLSQDKELMKIFQRGEDVHCATAAKIYHVSLNEVTKQMRSAAKTVNFGVLYGQGPRALAQQTGLSLEAARDFIAKYFALFAGLKAYIEEVKVLARSLGYVETLGHRRRYLPDLFAGIATLRAAAERMAVNTPMQGTAAELMKIAMIRVYNRLQTLKHDEARLLLQVHDELVLEVTTRSVKKVARIVKQEMEQALVLSVPLLADVAIGDNWGEIKKIDVGK